MRRRSVLYGSLAIAAVGLLVACGDDSIPVKPSELSPSPFAGIQVVGPDLVGSGQSAQFVAKIRQADGTTKSATKMPNLEWRSSNNSLMSVSPSGVVTASSSTGGEAVISAELTGQPALRGTREVVVQPPPPTAVVTGTLEVSQTGTGDKVEYVFAVRLTESKGVPATVTAAWIHLDSGWSGECSFDPKRLGQRRVPANGTLALDPLTCPSYGTASNADVSFNLTDDNGHELQLFLSWVGKQ